MLKAVYAALLFLFSGGFQAFVNFFLKYFTKRVALGASAVAVFLVFLAAFIAALTVLVNSIAVAMPQSMVLAMSWFIPSNASACLSAYFAALAARAV